MNEYLTKTLNIYTGNHKYWAKTVLFKQKFLMT